MPLARALSLSLFVLLSAVAAAAAQPAAVPIAQDCSRGGPVPDACLGPLVTPAGWEITAGPAFLSPTEYVVAGTVDRRRWPAARTMPEAWPWVPGRSTDGFVARYRTGDAVADWIVPFSASRIRQVVAAPDGGVFVLGTSWSPRVPDPPVSGQWLSNDRPFIVTLDGGGRVQSVAEYQGGEEPVITVDAAGLLVTGGAWAGLRRVDPRSGALVQSRVVGPMLRAYAAAGTDVLLFHGWADGVAEPHSVSRWRGVDLEEVRRVPLPGLGSTSAFTIAEDDNDHAWVAVLSSGPSIALAPACDGVAEPGTSELLLLRVSWSRAAIVWARCLARWRQPGTEFLRLTADGRVITFGPAAPQGESPERFEPTVFVSQDGGLSWREANDGLPAEINRVEVSPASSSVAFATAAAGLFKTEDGGRSWRDVTPVANHSLVVAANPHRTGDVWVQARREYFEKRQFRSRDGGATWQQTSPESLPGQFVPLPVWFDPRSERLWAPGPPAEAGLVTSVDGAVTWQAWGGNGLLFLSGDPGSRGYATNRLSSESVLWWTADGARTWAPGIGLPADLSLVSVTAVPLRPDRALAVMYSIDFDRDSAWLTSNGGASWQQAGAPWPSRMGHAAVGWTRAAAPVLYAWSPAPYPDRRSRLSVSFDVGASWLSRSGCEGCESIALSPENPEVLYASGRGRQYRALRAFDPLGSGAAFAVDLSTTYPPRPWLKPLAPEESAYAPDADGNGLMDVWERQFGPGLGDGEDDPDGDGVVNRDEMLGRTHPTAAWVAGFAEGFGPLFETRIDVFNPDPSRVARVWVRGEASGGVIDARLVLVPANARRSLAVPGDLTIAGAHAVVVESDVEVVATRTSTWGNGVRGVHAESARPPQTAWWFAEGSVQAGFDLFYLLHNPTNVPTDVRITWLRQRSAEPVVTRHALPAHSRVALWVNHDVPGLRGDDVAAVLESVDGVAFLAERSLYRSDRFQHLLGGSSASGSLAATRRVFAEGASGGGFGSYLLLANPHETDVEADVEFLLADGSSVARRYTLPARRRVTLDAASAVGSPVPMSFSTIVTAARPIAAERATWWPRIPGSAWWLGIPEGHVSAGSSSPSPRWVLTSAVLSRTEAGQFRLWETFLAIAKLSEEPDELTIRLHTEEGVLIERAVPLPAGRRRLTLTLSDLVGTAVDDRQEGITVQLAAGSAATQLVVEQASYGGRAYRFDEGFAVSGTPLPH